MDEFPSSTMLFVNTPPRQRRLPAFIGSVLLHCALIVVLATWSVRAPIVEPRVIPPNYSIRFLHLQAPSEHRGGASSSASLTASVGPSRSAALAGSGKSRTSARHAPAASPGTSGKSGADAPATPVVAREHRQFQLPPQTHRQPVTQTLVQMDVPPQIVLKREIPLPTVVLWTQPKPVPPMRKQFVAPPVKKAPLVAQSLPVAAALEPPNQEIAVSNVNIAAGILRDTPRLVQPPSIASPVSSPGQEQAKEIPQIGLASSTQPSAANLISLPNTPLRSASLLGLPPANQIAAHDVANAGSSAGNGGTGQTEQGSAALGHGVNAAGAAESGVQGKGSGGNASGSLVAGNTGTGSGNSNTGAGGTKGTSAGNGGGGTASAGSGGGKTASTGNGGTGTIASAGAGGAGSSNAGAGNGTGADLGNGLVGVTRITLPKDGKFGVVVSGSADTTRYPESVGALSGKVVYTVYLRVGLHKNWILQYCLPKSNDKSVATRGSSTPLEAPWPFLIMRPDRLSASDPDYIMVHGMLTTDGQFDQLAMVFPEELEKKDLLLKSLKLWAFRPVSRDGEPTAVEVLLIIPRETE
jgi:hypothetical protein